MRPRGDRYISFLNRFGDTGGPPELKSDEKQDVPLLCIEIQDCEQMSTAGKVLPFIGASVSYRTYRLVAGSSGSCSQNSSDFFGLLPVAIASPPTLPIPLASFWSCHLQCVFARPGQQKKQRHRLLHVHAQMQNV